MLFLVPFRLDKWWNRQRISWLPEVEDIAAKLGLRDTRSREMDLCLWKGMEAFLVSLDFCTVVIGSNN